MRAAKCANVLGVQSCEGLDTDARRCCVQVVQKKYGLTATLQSSSTPEIVPQRKTCGLFRRNKKWFVTEPLWKTHDKKLNVSWSSYYLCHLLHKNIKVTSSFTGADKKTSR